MIFKTFENNDVDKWTAKIGLFGKSFNDVIDSINKRKLDIDNLMSSGLNYPPEMVHRSTKNMIKNTRRGLYYITPEFQEEICQASFCGLSPRFRQPLLFHSTSI